MKRLLKKIIPIMALLMLCTTVLTCLFGCTDKNSNRFDTDLFCCMYNKDKTGVIILSLTKKGKEQEVLVIPEGINGLPVVQLGGTTPGYPYQMQHYVESDNLKKIYICSTSFLYAEKSFSNLSEVIIMNENPFYTLAVTSDMFSLKSFSDEITFFTTKEIYQKYQERILEKKDQTKKYKIADITYYKNIDGDLTICWIDDTTSIFPKYIPFPMDSIYTDIDCTTVWNGIYEIPDDGLKLYIKAVETR